MPREPFCKLLRIAVFEMPRRQNTDTLPPPPPSLPGTISILRHHYRVTTVVFSGPSVPPQWRDRVEREPVASPNPGEQSNRKGWMLWVKEKKRCISIPLTPQWDAEAEAVHFCEFKASLVYITYNTFQGYTVRPCLKKKKSSLLI